MALVNNDEIKKVLRQPRILRQRDALVVRLLRRVLSRLVDFFGLSGQDRVKPLNRADDDVCASVHVLSAEFFNAVDF